MRELKILAFNFNKKGLKSCSSLAQLLSNTKKDGNGELDPQYYYI